MEQQKYALQFEVFMVVTLKNSVFWDKTLCGSGKNRCFASIIRVRGISELGMLAVTGN
jgi:hypothetical protein